jgi:hypothetical protein
MPPGDRQGQVPGAVVGQLEQRLAPQLPEHGQIFVDPARVQEQRGRYLALPQELNQGRVVLAAARPAAGVEGQRDHSPPGGQVAHHPRPAESPVVRPELAVPGYHLSPAQLRRHWGA